MDSSVHSVASSVESPSGGNLPRRGSSPTNLFMSHSWDYDLRGRSTHDRVRKIKQELDKMGWKIWFDEERLLLGNNIDVDMANGIRRSDAVCVCITRSYVEKINAQNNNCAKEWNFAQSIGKRILPLIMEEEMLDVRSWPQGVMTMYLGNTFYIDCSSDNLPEIASKLSKMLELLGLHKRTVRSRNSWPLSVRSYPSANNGLRRTMSGRSVRTFVRI